MWLLRLSPQLRLLLIWKQVLNWALVNFHTQQVKVLHGESIHTCLQLCSSLREATAHSWWLRFAATRWRRQQVWTASVPVWASLQTEWVGAVRPRLQLPVQKSRGLYSGGDWKYTSAKICNLPLFPFTKTSDFFELIHFSLKEEAFRSSLLWWLGVNPPSSVWNTAWMLGVCGNHH